MYMNTIDAIQRQNIFKVQPVNLFENRGSKEANKFDSGLFTTPENNIFNLNHPKISGSDTQARSLDLLA